MIILLKQISVIRKYLERLMTSALNIHIYQRTGIDFSSFISPAETHIKEIFFFFFLAPIVLKAGRETDTFGKTCDMSTKSYQLLR